jgi:AraC family transcriptional regulator
MSVRSNESKDMSHHNAFVEKHETAEPVVATPTCLALDEGTQLIAEEGGMLACILHRSCKVEQRVASHWVEQAAFFNGGVLMVTGEAPIRVRWRSTPEGLAVALNAQNAMLHMADVMNVLSHRSMMLLPIDPVVMNLAQALATAEHVATSHGVKDQVVELIVRRLNQLGRERIVSTQSHIRALSPWRLRKVESFVQAHLNREISLAHMAEAAGLSPMYFAAQFKAATGMRPHHYLLLQRIERAKLSLKHSNASILDVALSVGFQTQSHFTTVFKRMEKKTPNAWRQRNFAA